MLCIFAIQRFEIICAVEKEISVTATSRDEWLLRMRRDGKNQTAGRVPISNSEQFEEFTIRPIVNVQIMMVLAQFRHFIKKFKPVFNAYKRKVQTDYVEEVLDHDTRIRNSMIASVVGMMTLEEYEVYASMKDEANRRIIKVLGEKVSERVEELY